MVIFISKKLNLIKTSWPISLICPNMKYNFKVLDVLNKSKFLKDIDWKIEKKKNFKENIFNLNNAKARKYLKWKPFELSKTVKLTIDWYRFAV